LVMNNLHQYLAGPDIHPRNARGEALFVGRKLDSGSKRAPRIFNSGGAGYLVSGHASCCLSYFG
jgi:hypothetical protein